MSHFKKYRKDYMLLLMAVTIGILAVSSDGFSDMAETKFWWNFWTVIQLISLAAWIGLWIYFKTKDNAQAKREKENY